MCIKIKQTSDREFHVNGKPVYMDSNDNWIAKNLDTKETRAAADYMAALNRQED